MRRILHRELQQIQATPSQTTQTAALLATFGTWEDDRSVEAIINDIVFSCRINPLLVWLVALFIYLVALGDFHER